MREKIRIDAVVAGDLLEDWKGTHYRSVSVQPSPSGKIIKIEATVECSPDPLLWAGRPMRLSHRAGTMITRISDEP